KMYSCHQDNELLESSVDTKQIGLEDDYMVPNLTESVSRAKDGKIHITLTNLSLDEAYDIETLIPGLEIRSAAGEMVGGAKDALNTFDEPDNVKIEKFDDIKIEGDKLTFKIPASTVLHIEVAA
ncbi:MAG: alpha-N-arabinofuranosidase, partial [Clostridiales bacterium]|nr:alpha-N-arabinofuranosidase [Clostridiales bacterium]